jgi:hypothetical protein
MKRFADQTEATVIQPIVLNPKTVDEYLDASVLTPDKMATANNVITDDSVIEKVLGTNKQNFRYWLIL